MSSRSAYVLDRNSFKYRAGVIWNRLPIKVKSIENYEHCKKELSKISNTLDSVSFGISSSVPFTQSDFRYF